MSGMDLLLVSPGGRDQVYQLLGGGLAAIEPPLWTRLIGGYLLDRGVSLQILDSEAEGLGPDGIAAAVAAARPALVAMVVFGHQPSASTQLMAAAGEACRAIKRVNPDQRIIMLGGHVSALPERTLREEAVDYVCQGEGPLTIHRLLEQISARHESDLSEVPGLVWRERGTIRANPTASLVQDLDGDLHGNVWHLLPMSKYRAHNWQCLDDLNSRQPYASIYTSLGCPYRCSFCCINAPFGVNRYRMRSPEKVVAEIDLLYQRYGVRTFKIIDEMFVLNERHVTDICERLAAKPYASELNIWAYARVDTVARVRLPLLRAAGIRWLALGIESGSEHVREGAEKAIDQGDIVDIVAQIREAGIHVMGNFIFGLPDDDLETMRETLDLAKRLNCEFVNFYSAMAYPGSKLYQIALDENWPLPKHWTGFSQHSRDCQPVSTQKIPAREVLAFRDLAFHEYFTDSRYLEMIDRKFGPSARLHIEEVTSVRLHRDLLELNPEAAS